MKTILTSSVHDMEWDRLDRKQRLLMIRKQQFAPSVLTSAFEMNMGRR